MIHGHVHLDLWVENEYISGNSENVYISMMLMIFKPLLIWIYIIQVFPLYVMFLLKESYSWVFFLTLMIVLLDTGADNDVASKEHVTHDWCGLGSGLKDGIRPSISFIYVLP